jgi:bacillithiol biosynthesis cysteine-adding enzyme BshC
LGSQGALHKVILPTQATPDAPVGTVAMDERAQSVLQEAAGLLGETEAVGWLRECYRPGAKLGDAFAQLFRRLFAEFGLILLDPSDAELHGIAQPIYRAAIERSAEVNDLLLQRGKALEAAGYHQQVKVAGSSTLLFLMSNGSRVAVQRRNGGSFVAGQETFDQKQMLERLAASPQDFSANVLLRPVIQDFLLPTLSYAGGAAEVAYFAQAEVVYRALTGRVTPILPRLSATIVDAKAQSLLKKYDLSFPDVFRGPEKLQEELASRALPEKLQVAFEKAKKSLSDSMESVRDSLGRLDVTLVEAAQRAESKMQYQLQRLQGRAARAELRRNELLRRHAGMLGHELFPNKTLQEREIGGIYFVSRYGVGWLQELSHALNSECLDHQLITM